MNRLVAMQKDFSLSAVVAGFVAVLIGFASAIVIVFQAAEAAGADAEIMSSWVFALGVGMGLTSFGLSLWLRVPIIIAWSTPGAALLATSLNGVSLEEATGAFLFSSLLIFLVGISGWFHRLMRQVPMPIAAAMLAGILVNFGLAVFDSMMDMPLLVGTMCVTYLLAKQISPRYAILSVLLVGGMMSWVTGNLSFADVELSLSTPVWVWPQWSLDIMLGVGFPLFVVTMTAQNIPGVAVLKSSGYDAPISSLISWTGVVSLVFAPLGGFAYNLAAITAAICSGPESHADPAKRYIAGCSAGLFYLIAGIGGATVVSLFAAFPAPMVAALAGLALLGTIGANLASAMEIPQHREAALVTFLVTSSGVSFFGIASAFWGIVFGMITMLAVKLPFWKSIGNAKAKVER